MSLLLPFQKYLLKNHIHYKKFLPEKKLRWYHRAVKIRILILCIVITLLVSGCSKLEALRTNVQKTTANVIEGAQESAIKVKDGFVETKQNVERKIQKVENLVNAVDDLKKEF